MKNSIFTIYLIGTFLLAGEMPIAPLSMKSLYKENRDFEYMRGSYLIILAHSQLSTYLSGSIGGSFIEFKESQGFGVDLMSLDVEELETTEEIRDWIGTYYSSHPSLEYVLLVGDVNGSFTIPSFSIQSINEPELDVTDYPYTYFVSNDILAPKFFIGRWSVRSPTDLLNIKIRTIQYTTMENLSETEKQYLNNALLVAGNYKQTSDGDEVPPETWPVTPVWTSFWLMEELYQFGYTSIDTAFFHAGYQISNNPVIEQAWIEGVSIINYRGWGNSHGWHKPEFYIEDINDLNHGWKLPVVMSFVCNTGDFGADIPPQTGPSKCFGEELLTRGSPANPKGAAAMIGPSDLDTDTRFNNVMCGAMWDEFLEGRISEIGPALFAGKQALIKEFPELAGADDVVEFYHHIYGILGDPSLPVWLGTPQNLYADVESNPVLHQSYISTVVTDENGFPLMDVVGALMHNGGLIAKGLSNQDGFLDIDFEGLPDEDVLDLYLNKAQFFQKRISLTFSEDDETELIVHDYLISTPEPNYGYDFTISDYNWQEISDIGENLNLVDDSHAKDVSIGFDFQFYGESYNSLTVGSNGWASFFPCLAGNGNCRVINHFFNNSIGFPIGPYGMLAPFFDDLDDNGGTLPFNVYAWENPTNQRFVLQWDNVSNGQDDEFCPDCVKETFQLILDGDDMSESGDGAIIFQYKEIHDIDDHGCTIGIEAPDKNKGVQYLFNYQYSEGADTLTNGLAIKFTNQIYMNPSVYPGDTNNDGFVNESDVLPLGIYFFITGPQRSTVGYNWSPSSPDSSWNPIAATYADANGDGIINERDLFGIGVNWGMTHTNGSNKFVVDPSDSELLTLHKAALEKLYQALGGDGEPTQQMKLFLERILGIEHIPDKFYLYPNYPNPFNPSTTIKFDLHDEEYVTLNIFDIGGKLVETLLEKEYYKGGTHTITLQADHLSNGLYFYQITAGKWQSTQKMIILK
jgi:hypothetical protein